MSFETELQEADINASWHNCTMYKTEPDTVTGGINVLMVEEGKVIAHFNAKEEDDGVKVDPIGWMRSKVGQIEQPRKFKSEGWTISRDVRYNSLTNEVIL